MITQRGSLNQKIKVWLREIRAPFLTATLIPVCFGASLAWYYHASFQLFPFLITLIAAVLLHMGTNLANDYFDHKSGGDAINEDFIPGFSGGSRLIQEGILEPRTVYHAAIFCFASAMVLSISLILYRGPLILVLGIIGIFFGYTYTTKLASSYVGEIVVGLSFGPLMVSGSYFVQVGIITWVPVIASIPISLLIAAVLWINEVPDAPSDKKVGKTTLVVRLGKYSAVRVYAAMMILVYLSIGIGVLIDVFPFLTIISILTLPLAISSIRTALTYYDGGLRLAPANKGTVMIHLLIGLCLIGSFSLSPFLVVLMNL